MRENVCDVDVDRGEEDKLASLVSSRIRITLEWFVDNIHQSKHQNTHGTTVVVWANAQQTNLRLHTSSNGCTSGKHTGLCPDACIIFAARMIFLL
jgi:hypothetical protein